MKLINKVIILALILGCLQGCMVAAVGAGVGAWKYGNAKKTEAQGKTMSSYNEYVLGMQNVNIQRQKSGLKPEPIMTYPQYIGK